MCIPYNPDLQESLTAMRERVEKEEEVKKNQSVFMSGISHNPFQDVTVPVIINHSNE